MCSNTRQEDEEGGGKNKKQKQKQKQKHMVDHHHRPLQFICCNFNCSFNFLFLGGGEGLPILIV